MFEGNLELQNYINSAFFYEHCYTVSNSRPFRRIHFYLLLGWQCCPSCRLSEACRPYFGLILSKGFYIFPINECCFPAYLSSFVMDDVGANTTAIFTHIGLSKFFFYLFIFFYFHLALFRLCICFRYHILYWSCRLVIRAQTAMLIFAQLMMAFCTRL